MLHIVTETTLYYAVCIRSAVRPRRSEKSLKTREDIVALFPVPEGAPSVHHPLLTSR